MLWMVGALLFSSTAFATGDTGLTQTGDTGLSATDTGEQPIDTDNPDPQDTGDSVTLPDPSASTLAGEVGGFRCAHTGALASLGPLALLLLLGVRRR